MIIFSDSRDPIFNSRDPNGVPKTPLKNVVTLNLMSHDSQHSLSRAGCIELCI